MEQKRWSDLSLRSRRLILVAGSCETVLKAVALADLRRRPAEQVRGKKWAWAVALVLANSVGAVPVAYLVFGRRTSS